MEAPTKPKYVFRYFNEEYGLQALQTKKWKLGRLADLNDPFDCQPILKNLPEGVNADNFTNEYLNKFNDRLGILCYCSKIDDPVMWTHYAGNHRGMALAFSYQDPRILSTLHEVKYEVGRPVLDYNELRESIDKSEEDNIHKVIERGFTVKGKRWEYESEYRQFIWLNHRSPFGDGVSMKGRHYFKGILMKDFAGVILGAKCSISNNDIERIYAEHDYSQNLERSLRGLDGVAPRIRRAKMSSSSVLMDVDWPMND